MIYIPKSEELGGAILNWTQQLAPHGIFATDEALTIQSWNNWLEVHSHINASDAIGHTIAELFPNFDSERLLPHFKKALQGQVSVLSASLHGYLLPLETTVEAAPYPFMQQTARIGPLLSGSEICGTLTTIEDVTNRTWQSHLLQQQNERTALLSWALEHLLKTHSPHDVIQELLPKVGESLRAGFYACYLFDDRGENFFRHVLGGSSAPVHVLKTAPFCRKENPTSPVATVADFIERHFHVGGTLAVQNGLQSMIWEPLIAGSRVFGFLLVASQEKSRFEPKDSELLRNVAQYVSIALDRTFAFSELVKAQRALAEHAASLERKVEERTSNLVDTISDLEGFSYTVAHDLRAPIRHIKGYIDMLEDDPTRTGEDIETLGRIKASASSMETLTRDLLHYSGIARKEFRLQPVSVEAMIDELVKRDVALSEPGVVTIERPLDNVLAEPTLLQQCILNLLENARKFVPPGIRPQIKIWKEKPRHTAFQAKSQNMVFNAPKHLPAGATAERRKESMTVTVPDLRPAAARSFVRICISDNGIGIAKEFQQKIFGVFERACDPQTYPGTGIGLAIVAKAIHRMGGRYGVESEPGHGSQFWLELPSA